MTKYINGIKTEKQLKREAKTDKVIKNTLWAIMGFVFIMAYDTPAEAAIIIEQPHKDGCYEFQNVQDIEEIVNQEFDKKYTSEVDDYFKVNYTLKPEYKDKEDRVLTEEEYNKERNRLKSIIMLKPCSNSK
ncbi:TPA: hypothetical protein ACJXXT_000166 [Pseudomonas aeruginosa]